MSGQAWTWRHAILEAELPATTKHVLLTISCFMNDVGEGCYRTTKELAQFTGLSERAVCTHIENAVKLGWLKKSQHGFRGQKWKRHEYAPLWPKGAEPSSAASKEALNVVQEGTEPNDKKALNQVQRDKNISKNISKSFPSAHSREGGEFLKFWNEWPEAARPRERSFAEKLFVQLTPEDRALAVTSSSSYRATQTLRGGFAAMIVYLRDRLFLEFEDAPSIDSAGYFVIQSDRHEWTAWLKFCSTRYSEAILQSIQKRGFLLTRTRWPDEKASHRDSQQNDDTRDTQPRRHQSTQRTYRSTETIALTSSGIGRASQVARTN
jgi:hypothetical protein